MKKTKIILATLISSILMLSFTALASTKPTKTLSIILRDAPQHQAKIVAKVNPAQPLITIFQKGDWVKLGNPRNGQVGWANDIQYQTTMRAFYEPKTETQTVWVQSKKGGKKTVIKITAYQNGKKLSNKKAGELYKKLRQEQINEWQYMQNVDQRMNEDFAKQTRFFNHVFSEPLWMNMPMEPGIVILNPASQTHKK